MSSALNLDDYTRDFMVKVGNLDDFSRELMVKLARTMKIEPKYVVDYLELANLSIDGTLGYGGDQIARRCVNH